MNIRKRTKNGIKRRRSRFQKERKDRRKMEPSY
jgi:hypothetical protein